MAAHSSTLAWRIPWMDEPGRLYVVHGVMKSQTRLKRLSSSSSGRRHFGLFQLGLEILLAKMLPTSCNHTKVPTTKNYPIQYVKSTKTETPGLDQSGPVPGADDRVTSPQSFGGSQQYQVFQGQAANNVPYVTASKVLGSSICFLQSNPNRKFIN